MSEAATRVIATAGHVDHGKSTLVAALTGIDPDRLREERERGMTIDLGFAWLRLPSGTDVGIVDVPGHQDFIRNMLAGVGGVDAVLLVIAADEGVRPQTREHLAILGLLGVDRGVVALTKRDLVDDEWATLVRGEVAAALAATPLAGARIVEVSAARRTGLDALAAALDEVLGVAPARRDVGRPRLPIDRAFTMAGFGTVVTGTLVDGALAVGDEVEIAPVGIRARIRGLQTHRAPVELAPPGRRVAVNLSGVDRDRLARGMVLGHPGTLSATDAIALRLAVVAGASAPLEHGEELKVHTGAAEAMARLVVLEGDEIAPGSSAWAELRLAERVAVASGDRVVVRRPSPSETVGGGTVVDAAPGRLRRRELRDVLERRSAPTPAARLLAELDEPRTADDAGTRAGLEAPAAAAALAELRERGEIVALADAYLSRPAFEALLLKAERGVARVHREAPLRPGAPREEVRGLTGLPAKRFAALVAHAVGGGRLVERGNALALPGHEPRLDPAQEDAWRRARVAMAADEAHPPSPAQLAEQGIDRELLVALADRGDLVRVGTDAVFLPETVTRFAEAVVAELERAPSITVARARDLTASSRKHVLSLMQLLDDRGVTRRQGDERILVLAPDAARARIRAITSRRGEAE